METLTVSDRKAWRGWLSENHDKRSEIWLVYFKKGSGMPSLKYEETVEEALCFGWVDSLIKTMDDQRYTRKFTPRKTDSQWSVSNKRRVRRMVKAGLMTEHGLRLVEAAKRSGRWDEPVEPPQPGFDLHPEFELALRNNSAAMQTFKDLAPSYQNRYTAWINHAKRPETRRKRIREAVGLLEKGEKLGLK